MREEEFQKLVVRALDNMPKHIMRHLDNVAVCVEYRPTQKQLDTLEGTRDNSLLLGLYEGVPRTAWGRGSSGEIPDKITIFQQAIEKLASSPKDIEKIVKETVWHEIAHHFGYDESELEEMEKRKFSNNSK